MRINNNVPDTESSPSVRASRRRQRTQAKEKIVSNKPCPTCREKGGDKTGNHMMVFESGAGYCNRCSKAFSKEEVEMASSKRTSRRAPRQTFQSGYSRKPELTLEDISHFGFLGDRHRGITPDADRHFGIKTEVSENNRKPLKRYYPYYVEDELYGYKVRELPKRWDTDIGNITGTEMFGWNLRDSSYNLLIVVEGEEDAAAAYQMHLAMNKRSDNRRIKKSIPNVISLPNGATGAHKALMHHFEEISKYRKIYWLGDNPAIDKDGREALDVATSIFGVDKIFVPEWIGVKKDACDILKVGGDEAIDIYASMYFEAKPFSPTDIKEGSEYTWDDLFAEPVIGYDLPFKSVSDQIGGLRLREHTLLLSASGVGKSTIARLIGHHMAKEHGWKVGSIFLEEQDKKTAQGYIAAELGIALNLLRKDPSIFDEEDKKRAMDYIADKHIFLTHNGSISKEALMSKIRYLHAKGATMIIVDHLSMATNGSDDERRELDSLLEEMYKFTELHDVHLLSVIHLNRGGANNQFARGAEISENNIRGSAGVLQQVWNAIAVEADIQHETLSGARFFRILKCREIGEAVGLVDGGYRYDGNTGTLSFDGALNKDMVCPLKAKEKQYAEGNKPRMGGGYDNKAS